MDNIFSPQSQADKEALKVSQQEAVDKIKRTAEAAQACLGSEQFATYKRDYEKAETQIVDVMIRYTKSFFSEDKGDISKYGAMMSRYITKLDDMRMLLRQVGNDAKRKGKD